MELVPRKNTVVRSDEAIGVVESVTASVEGTFARVKWFQDKKTSVMPINSLRSGFQVGMSVYHEAEYDSKDSLGEGVVINNRTIGGSSQVLVQFDSTGITRWLPFQSLVWIKAARERFLAAKDSEVSSFNKFKLKFIANALKNWNENTGAMSKLDIDPLPHQVHLVHHILSQGHANWLIADDVGLGKTIETGMLLKALHYRDEVKRVLLITPAGLTRQWKDELRYKFGFDEFRIYGQDFNINAPREWKMYDFAIASIDKIKDGKDRELLLSSEGWDLVIFDEAHRLSSRQYGLRVHNSKRFNLAKKLRSKTRNLLLLTATPHQGKDDQFKALLKLIRPDLTSEIETLSLNPEILSQMIIRNHKADVTDAEGNFIFNGNITKAVKVPVSEAVLEFDRKLKDYLKRGYAKAANSDKATSKAIGFVMTVYRKLAASSLPAIHSALLRRKERLLAENESILNIDEIDDERFSGEFEEKAQLTGGEFFEGELKALEDLIDNSGSLIPNDEKMDSFLNQIIGSLIAKNSKEKVLIFTEYRATQDYIKEKLEKVYGTGCTSLINGSMNLEEREYEIQRFEEGGQFLISTEAGGEGINLQKKCHIMVNFDLPWNPMRLVQRIGRLYRYGQKKKVLIFNLHSPDTGDDHIISLMFERIEQVVGDLSSVSGEFNERLSDDIFGQVMEVADIEEILESSFYEGIHRTKERIESALEKAKAAAEKQNELFNYVERYDPEFSSKQIYLNKSHLELLVSSICASLSISIKFKQKSPVWELTIPEETQELLSFYKNKYRLTFERDYASRFSNISFAGLEDDFIASIVNYACGYHFGGQLSYVDLSSLGYKLIFTYHLRWLNEYGIRQKEEFFVCGIDSNGEFSSNSPEILNFILDTEPTGLAETIHVERKALLAELDGYCNRELKLNGSRWLFPDTFTVNSICSN